MLLKLSWKYFNETVSEGSLLRKVTLHSDFFFLYSDYISVTNNTFTTIKMHGSNYSWGLREYFLKISIDVFSYLYTFDQYLWNASHGLGAMDTIMKTQVRKMAEKTLQYSFHCRSITE